MSRFSAISASSAIFALFFSVSLAAGQAKWTLTTADFRTRQIELSSIDDTGVKPAVEPPVKWEDLLLLDREDAPEKATAGKFALFLTNGDQIRGDPVKIEGETLHFSSSALGAMQVSLSQVAAIVRANQPTPATDEKRSEDVVKLANGDSVRGIIASLADSAIKVRVDGNETAIPLENVASVLLATTHLTAGLAPRADRAFRVRVSDDSLVTATTVRSESDKLILITSDRATRTVPLASVIGIEQLNGPVSWLSSRKPIEEVQTPLLETSRPARMDRTVTGKPIRAGEQTFSRGVGVAPYSRITWALDGSYKAFRTQYAIDGSGGYADVTVRVKLDDRIVHERQDFPAGELAGVVVVPLAQGKRLTLEVDFGANLNVQDRFNWIEPALLRSMPPGSVSVLPAPATTAPATTRLAQ